MFTSKEMLLMDQQQTLPVIGKYCKNDTSSSNIQQNLIFTKQYHTFVMIIFTAIICINKMLHCSRAWIWQVTGSRYHGQELFLRLVDYHEYFTKNLHYNSLGT